MPELHNNVVKCFAYLSTLIELSKGRKVTGYDILIHLKNHGLEVSPGTIYHQLATLEKAGIIKRETQIRTKAEKTVYQMTEKGTKAFEEFKKKWKKPIDYAHKNIHT